MCTVTAGPHTFAQKARAAKAQGFSVRRSAEFDANCNIGSVLRLSAYIVT